MRTLVFLRLVVATLVVGAAVVVLQYGERGSPAGSLYGLLGVIYLTTGSLYLAARAGASARPLVWGTIAVDCAVLTAILHFSGGSASHFATLFILPIMLGGLWFETSGGLATAALATAAYLAYNVLEYGGRIHPRSLSVEDAGGDPLLRGYLLMAIFVLTGLLSGSYAARARRRGEELSRAENELRRVQLNTDSIITNVSSGLIVTNMTGEIVTCNPAAERILGLRRGGGSAGRLINDVIPHMSPLVQELESAIATGTQRRRHELEVRRLDGSVLPLGISISFLRGEQGEKRGVVAIFQDLTEVHRMREKVRTADKMAAIGELSTAIAHEIRAPLASICGSIDMLAQELELSGDNRRLMELVVKESDRLDRIITDFLEFARLRSPACESVDVEGCLDEVLFLLRHSTGIGRDVSIEVRSNAPHACVYADDEQIRQVFLNLIMNACEAMDRSGRLTIRIDSVATSLRDGSTPERCVAVDFINTGPAIPPDALPRIFEPFFTTKEGGTGLGLAIVARIVESHGGRVRAASAEGQGAVFTVILPVLTGSHTTTEANLQETFIGF
jgi:two-component system sensor histidine kinase PilS (NtrC family)